MNNEILWVGILCPPGSDYADLHFGITINPFDFCQGACVTTTTGSVRIIEHGSPIGTMAEIVDVAKRKRVGFGIRVAALAVGHAKLEQTARWLQSIGITLPVSIWAWSPSGTPAPLIRPVYPEPEQLILSLLQE